MILAPQNHAHPGTHPDNRGDDPGPGNNVGLGVGVGVGLAVAPGRPGRGEEADLLAARRSALPLIVQTKRIDRAALGHPVTLFGPAALNLLPRGVRPAALIATRPPTPDEAARVPRGLPITVFTEHDAQAWRAAGFEPRPHHPGPAAPSPTTLAPRAPIATRTEPLDEPGLSRSPIVIAPLANRPDLVDAARAVFLAGVLELVGRRVLLRLPESALGLPRARWFIARMGLSLSLQTVPGPMSAAWAGADVIFEIDHALRHLAGTGAEALLISQAASLGAAVFRGVGDPSFTGPVMPVPCSLWWAARPRAQAHEHLNT